MVNLDSNSHVLPGVLLVHLDVDKPCPAEIEEFRELAISASVKPLGLIRGVRKTPDAKYFVGSGKITEIADQVSLFSPDVVIFNHPLTPAQERNLILSHFGRRHATSFWPISHHQAIDSGSHAPQTPC